MTTCLDFLLLWLKLMVGFHRHLVDYVWMCPKTLQVSGPLE